MSWLDKLEYKKITELSVEQKQLIKTHFENLEIGVDGEATIYHIDNEHDLEEIIEELSERENLLLKEVLTALKTLAKQGDFDFVLQV